jgi:hypothetical protein
MADLGRYFGLSDLLDNPARRLMRYSEVPIDRPKPVAPRPGRYLGPLLSWDTRPFGAVA